ncbi:hypothetical protein FJ942_19295 [Mesorhizobium sp. B2-4-2]|uniref:response regulator receiver domain n=1 Tax=unclassified Mesorhizobium TaxID=325217 RepID=UPI00112AC521|nr:MULTISPECIES: response regulator receiver domain [unclassified Mesorhizobium]MBZ9918260.1 hypothetical protein [Mesorhizobium sp. BR1-1-7]MBZ9970641.1 hypothetical protein [Mesorhizobium sp. BR1-1-12]MBZ9970860.1 hypothetical protein [Mesorhizobium sp. BR1-1-12]TPL53674.1 hypothetical protein FJ942_19295 [Mesorhizobium sp. B2-4-2]
MVKAANAFTDYRLAGVRRFLQTAVVIDNEAELRTSAPAVPIEPQVARRRPGSVLGSAAAASPAKSVPAGNTGDAVAMPAPDAAAVVATPAADGGPGRLNAKILTDAFSRREIICGLYRPEAKEAEMVELATNAAKHADVVIVDWLLENNSSVRAVEIVISILQEDLRGNGRLRLMAIYTSLNGVSIIAKELLDQIEQADGLGGRFSLDGATIVGADVRICVLNKPQSIGEADVDRVAEADLPGRLLEEFARLSTGLLTSFALHSIAAVRRSAHHVVAVFGEHLDGAYLAHRSSLQDPDEATEFAINLLVGELQNAIAVDERQDGKMAPEVLVGWVESKAGAHKFRRGGEEALPELVKGLVSDGLAALKAATGKLVKADGNLSDRALKVETVGEIFYDSPQQAWERQLEFARLSIFKREAHGRSRLPDSWVPTLALGSVLKVFGPKNDAEKLLYDDLGANFFVCLQPVCDSVRIDELTGFPFQTGNAATQKFNLVVRERDISPGTPLLINSKLGHTHVLRFQPDQKARCVRATKVGDDFVFTDSRKREFIWLGDIRDMKAQHDATAIAANAQRVGLVELEWFRLATENKVEVYMAPHV